MENKIIIPMMKNIAPIISIEGHDFKLKMTESEIMAELASIMNLSNMALQDEKNYKGDLVENDFEKLSPDTIETMMSMGIKTADINTSGRRLINKMLGEDAYNKITSGYFYTSQDDLEIVSQIITAIREKTAEQRRAKLNAPNIKKIRAKK